jgi:heterodisulfide reductase subunit A-like polyferredoxin
LGQVWNFHSVNKGVIGLTTAINLLEKGEKVTIVTKNLSYSCSQVAGLLKTLKFQRSTF